MLQQRINACLVVFSEVAAELHLNLSRQKSNVMLFGRLTLDNRRPIFKLSGATVLVSETVAYLGFVLDIRFSRMEHLDIVRHKIHDFTKYLKLLNIKKTGCRHRGMNVDYLKLWYKGVIEKQIT